MFHNNLILLLLGLYSQGD